MNELTTIRQRLNRLLEDASADLEAREHAIAAATEQLSQDAAVRAAWRQGSAAMQGRVVFLIDEMRSKLQHSDIKALCLEKLRRQVLEASDA